MFYFHEIRLDLYMHCLNCFISLDLLFLPICTYSNVLFSLVSSIFYMMYVLFCWELSILWICIVSKIDAEYCERDV